MSRSGERVVFLRSPGPTDPVNSLWVVDRGSEPRLLFDAAAGADDSTLTEAEKARRERAREQAGGIVRYAATAECDQVVFVVGGELVHVDIDAGVVERFEAEAPFDPRPDRGGDRVAYVSGRSLRLAGATGDRAVPGTEDEDPNVSWGSAEFVAAEEMGRTRGFWWTPDGNSLLATRVDVSPVAEWWIGSPEEPARAPRPVRYPAAGTENATVELWVLDPDDGPVIEIDWRMGVYEYLAAVSVTERVVLVVQTRDQRRLALLEVDVSTGATTEVAAFTDDHWVELVPGTPTAVAGSLAVVVDQGGTRRIVVDGAPLTADDLVVRSVLGADGETLWATVAPDARGAVVATVAADGTVTELTDGSGVTAAAVGGGTVALTEARADGPTTYSIRWSDGSTVEVESHAAEPGFACTPQFHVVGDRRLNTALCLPAGHDGSPLPVLLDPYGGPHAQRVLFARNAFATSQWFAEQGFAVVVTDGRGTPGRGPAFEREVWGDLAAPVLDDQIEALERLAAERSELDLSRVGIRGWSFGGYLAALAVLRRPDRFHAAVAGAPVTDWLLYDTHYTERYLGHPDTHPEHYERTSLLTDAHRLERPLLLIHGLADDNVVAAHTLQLSRALLEAGRPHQVLPLSGVTHMTPQEQVAENLLHLQRDFLRDALTTSKI